MICFIIYICTIDSIGHGWSMTIIGGVGIGITLRIIFPSGSYGLTGDSFGLYTFNLIWGWHPIISGKHLGQAMELLHEVHYYPQVLLWVNTNSVPLIKDYSWHGSTQTGTSITWICWVNSPIIRPSWSVHLNCGKIWKQPWRFRQRKGHHISVKLYQWGKIKQKRQNLLPSDLGSELPLGRMCIWETLTFNPWIPQTPLLLVCCKIKAPICHLFDL